MQQYLKLSANPAIASLKEIPVLEYRVFSEQISLLLNKHSCHCLNYFVRDQAKSRLFIMVIADDAAHSIHIFSHRQPAGKVSIESLTPAFPQLHIFEREIWENHGVEFLNHPWLKPLRFSSGRYQTDISIADYPFYSIESEELHEVGVGPVHAGVIEPGHFRFICYGEKVLHLEIQLGYQHRGVENQFLNHETLLGKSLLAENIAGDTSVGHGLAFSQLAEALAGVGVPERLQIERIIALELERIAVHIGDTAALCGDVAYQLGQVACEALRTMVINTTQDWCGNRFGKGLVRPGGTNYPLSAEMRNVIRKNLSDVLRRYLEVAALVFNNQEVISRFENTGIVTSYQALLAGAVGMAARMTKISRDIRVSHPFQAYNNYGFETTTLEGGDVLCRAFLRKKEIRASAAIINDLLDIHEKRESSAPGSPDYRMIFVATALPLVSLRMEGRNMPLSSTDLTAK
jgi:Ni,Fe-hydrogenase III large subunit